MPKRALFVAVLLALPWLESRALANGRFPRAERLLEDPANPSRLVLAATYGLLTTHDGGRTWFHTCETAFADTIDYSNDPIVDFVAGGAVLADVQSAVNRSSDDCRWVQTLGTASNGNETIDDLAVDRAHGAIVVAVVTNVVGNTTVIGLRRSSDGGATWASVGTPLPLSTVLTVDLDPSDPTHLYASGISSAGAAVLLASTDGGNAWTTSVIAGTATGDLPYIAAVAPDAPGGVFVRTSSVTRNAQGAFAANDALFYTSDGGSTWKELLHKNAKLLGFALSPDATKIAVGYGIDDASTEAGVAIDAGQTGMSVAVVGDWRFEDVFAGQPVTCITWTSLGTYACTQLPASGSLDELVFFPNGVLAPDAGVNASTSLMRLSAIAGPPPCCGAIDAVCDWASLCGTFGACPDGSAGALGCDAGSTGGDDATASSPSDSSGGGGFDTSPVDSSASNDGSSLRGEGAAADGGSAARATGSGCACRSSGPASAPAQPRGRVFLGFVGALALVVMRKRRD